MPCTAPFSFKWLRFCKCSRSCAFLLCERSLSLGNGAVKAWETAVQSTVSGGVQLLHTTGSTTLSSSPLQLSVVPCFAVSGMLSTASASPLACTSAVALSSPSATGSELLGHPSVPFSSRSSVPFVFKVSVSLCSTLAASCKGSAFARLPWRGSGSTYTFTPIWPKANSGMPATDILATFCFGTRSSHSTLSGGCNGKGAASGPCRVTTVLQASKVSCTKRWTKRCQLMHPSGQRGLCLVPGGTAWCVVALTSRGLLEALGWSLRPRPPSPWHPRWRRGCCPRLPLRLPLRLPPRLGLTRTVRRT
mmetsp:Transcript_2398/g.5601  ORF Transcript_2398/g.5601 Transcript_2398/m.5601 type:complete len:305 (+) Transcript_2398:693-1607(+)